MQAVAVRQPEEVAAEVVAWADSGDARQQLVLKYHAMARAIACRVYHRLPKVVDLDDLISAAVTGLIEAIDRYDPSRKVPFEAYAKHRVHGAVVDSLRAADWVPRAVRRRSDQIKNARERLVLSLGRDPTRDELALELEVSPEKLDKLHRDSQIKPLFSLDAPVGADNSTPLVEQLDDGGVNILDGFQNAELRSMVVQAVQQLPDRERTAVGLYYLHELSLKEVGKVLGVTESRACQLCSAGIKRLRFRMRDHLK